MWQYASLPAFQNISYSSLHTSSLHDGGGMEIHTDFGLSSTWIWSQLCYFLVVKPWRVPLTTLSISSSIKILHDVICRTKWAYNVPSKWYISYNVLSKWYILWMIYSQIDLAYLVYKFKDYGGIRNFPGPILTLRNPFLPDIF